MSVELISDPSPQPDFGAEPPAEAARAYDYPSQVVDGPPPQAAVASGLAETVEALLLSVARGDQEAFVTLQSRIAGLVRVNVRRILRDASRSEAVTQQTFAEVLEDAIHFDPHRDSAQTWLLTRAHQHAMDELRSRTMDQQPSVDDTDEPRSR